MTYSNTDEFGAKDYRNEMPLKVNFFAYTILLVYFFSFGKLP